MTAATRQLSFAAVKKATKTNKKTFEETKFRWQQKFSDLYFDNKCLDSNTIYRLSFEHANFQKVYS